MNAKESHSPESGGGAEDEHRVIQQIKVARRQADRQVAESRQRKRRGGCVGAVSPSRTRWLRAWWARVPQS